ncbi:MAG: hypothetical protein IKQ91_11695 [Oscillospiraceae bacterium]|nr:hypothetical protein [Oscillospiraceae bacterium]
MKNSTKIALLFLTGIEILGALLLFNLMSGASFIVKLGVLAAIVLISLALDAAVLHGNSASVVSDAKKLKDADDYIKAFNAWLNEDTPFEEYIKMAVKQLESLKRKQKALRAVLDDSKDSPFLTTANEVDSYILANCKRILNRVMIYDQGEPHKYNMHVAYLQEILGENAHVLSDFENLILEVSQIGDDATAATPCLNELTNALRSVRKSAAETWDAAEPDKQEPQQTMRMQ